MTLELVGSAEANEKMRAVRRLLADYQKSADEKQRNELVEQITKLSTDQFEVFQKQREDELKGLEDKVKTLREVHARREKEKKQIIDDRVRGLLRNAEGLGWGEANAPLAFGTVNTSPFAAAAVNRFPSTQPATGARMLGIRNEVPRFQQRSEPVTYSTEAKKTVKVFSLQFAKAKDLAGTLHRLFQSGDMPVRVEADERTNSILVSAEESELETIEALIKRLDQEAKAPARDSLFSPSK